MTFTPTVGTQARVRYGGSTALDGAAEWEIVKEMAVIPLNHFELAANSDGVVFQAFGNGLASATATVSGIYNTDATLKTEAGTPGLRLGLTVTLDLLFNRTGPFGYTALAAIVKGFRAGTGIENKPGTFTATFQVTGLVPSAG